MLVTETRVNPADPERESVTFTETLIGTSLLFGGQRTFGLVLHATVGGVLSILIPLTVADAEFPAMSVHVPVTDWLAPSVESVVGAGGLPAARPESASAHWKLTVTALLFQPFALGDGAAVPLMVGGVLSSLKVVDSVASVLPARSTLAN